MHLFIEGFTKGKRITSATVSTYIKEAAKLASDEGMKIVEGPMVILHDGKLIGFAVIAESHIAVHYDVPTTRMWIDIFSCVPFDATKLLDYTKEYFNLDIRGGGVIPRGLEYL